MAELMYVVIRAEFLQGEEWRSHLGFCSLLSWFGTTQEPLSIDADQAGLARAGRLKGGREQQAFRSTYHVLGCLACTTIFNYYNKPGKHFLLFICKKGNVPGMKSSIKYGCKAEPLSLLKIPSNQLNTECFKFGKGNMMLWAKMILTPHSCLGRNCITTFQEYSCSKT